MFAASVLATPLLTNVPAVPEVHVPAPVSLPTVEADPGEAGWAVDLCQA